MAALIELLILMGIINSAKEATPEILKQNQDILGGDIIF
jgi:hypothetical protein